MDPIIVDPTWAGPAEVPHPNERRLPGMQWAEQLLAHQASMGAESRLGPQVTDPGTGAGIPQTQMLQSSIGLLPGEVGTGVRLPPEPQPAEQAQTPPREYGAPRAAPVAPGSGLAVPIGQVQPGLAGPVGGGLVGLRTPFGPVYEPRDREPSDFGYFARTGYRHEWGVPPQLDGLVWSRLRGYYEPSNDLHVGKHGELHIELYRERASRGIYVQPYPDATDLGVWHFRWVRADPDSDDPYEIMGELKSRYADRGPEVPEARPRLTAEGYIDLSSGFAYINPIGSPPPPVRYSERDYVWIPRDSIPRQCGAYPYPALPVPHADYESGRWLEHDYVPSIPLPPGYDQVHFQCAHPPQEGGKKGKGGGKEPEPREPRPVGSTLERYTGDDLPYDPTPESPDDIMGSGQIGIARGLLEQEPSAPELSEDDKALQEAVDDDARVQQERDKLERERDKQARLRTQLGNAKGESKKADLKRKLDKSVAKTDQLTSSVAVAEARAAEKHLKGRLREEKRRLQKLKYERSITWNKKDRDELNWRIGDAENKVASTARLASEVTSEREGRESGESDNTGVPGFSAGTADRTGRDAGRSGVPAGPDEVEVAVGQDPKVKKERKQLETERAKQDRLRAELRTGTTPGRKRDLDRMIKASEKRVTRIAAGLKVTEVRAAGRFTKLSLRDEKRRLQKLKYTLSTTWNSEKRADLRQVIGNADDRVLAVGERLARITKALRYSENERRKKTQGPGPGAKSDPRNPDEEDRAPAEVGFEPPLSRASIDEMTLEDALALRDQLSALLQVDDDGSVSYSQAQANAWVDQLESVDKRIQGELGIATGRGGGADEASARRRGEAAEESTLPGPGVLLTPRPEENEPVSWGGKTSNREKAFRDYVERLVAMVKDGPADEVAKAKLRLQQLAKEYEGNKQAFVDSARIQGLAPTPHELYLQFALYRLRALEGMNTLAAEYQGKYGVYPSRGAKLAAVDGFLAAASGNVLSMEIVAARLSKVGGRGVHIYDPEKRSPGLYRTGAAVSPLDIELKKETGYTPVGAIWGNKLQRGRWDDAKALLYRAVENYAAARREFETADSARAQNPDDGAVEKEYWDALAALRRTSDELNHVVGYRPIDSKFNDWGKDALGKPYGVWDKGLVGKPPSKYRYRWISLETAATGGPAGSGKWSHDGKWKNLEGLGVTTKQAPALGILVAYEVGGKDRTGVLKGHPALIEVAEAKRVFDGKDKRYITYKFPSDHVRKNHRLSKMPKLTIGSEEHQINSEVVVRVEKLESGPGPVMDGPRAWAIRRGDKILSEIPSKGLANFDPTFE